jgi:ATP synthase protein I
LGKRYRVASALNIFHITFKTLRVLARNDPCLTLIPRLHRLPPNSTGPQDMSGQDDQARLRALEDRIARAKADMAPKPAPQDHHSAASMGWRMVIELVSGLLVGAGLGYGADLLLGTAPFLFIVFTLLGCAAGVQTMIRTARSLQARLEHEALAKAGAEPGDRNSGR